MIGGYRTPTILDGGLRTISRIRTLYSILIALASFGVWILGVWSDNISAQEAQKNDWLVFVGALMFGAAVVFFVGVMTGFMWLVLPAFLVSAVAGMTAVWYAITEESQHGDGELIAFTVGCGLAGVLALGFSVKATRLPASAP